MRHHRRSGAPRHPVNIRHINDRTLGERVADGAVHALGSWRFLGAQTVAMALWVLVNAFWLAHRAFDPYPFILLNLALSTQAGVAGPLILLAGNRQAAKDRDLAEHTYADTERMLDEIRRNTELTLQIHKRLEKGA